MPVCTVWHSTATQPHTHPKLKSPFSSASWPALIGALTRCHTLVRGYCLQGASRQAEHGQRKAARIAQAHRATGAKRLICTAPRVGSTEPLGHPNRRPPEHKHDAVAAGALHRAKPPAKGVGAAPLPLYFHLLAHGKPR